MTTKSNVRASFGTSVLLCIIFISCFLPGLLEAICQSTHAVTINEGNLEDFFDWNSGLSVPGEAWHNVVSLYAEISPLEVSVTVTMASNFPPNAWFSVELAFDTDLDEGTGQSTPTYAFNGIGADFDVGVEIKNGLVHSKWIENFTSSGWSKIGEPNVELGHNYVKITFLRSEILESRGDVQKSIRFVTFVLSGLVTDAVPNFGEEPPEIWLVFPPQAKIEAASEVAEGTEILLNGSASIPSDAPIVLYEWDLNGDGIPDYSSELPWVTAVYSDNAVVQVTLWVKDLLGLTDDVTHLITVFNIPPYNLSISTNGSLIAGEEITFRGQAFDPGMDSLTYEWNFGDGSLGQGQVVTHTYQSEGSYDVTLNVTDDDGGSSTMKVTVEIGTPAQPTPPPYVPSVSISQISPSKEDPKEGETVSFTITVFYDGKGILAGILKVFIDDPSEANTPFWQTNVELKPGSNAFTSPEWVSEIGEHDVLVKLEPEDDVDPVNESIKILVLAAASILPILLGISGIIISIILILMFLKKPKKGDFCKEHPEVVKEEEDKCWNAQLDLSTEIGDIMDRFEEQRKKWDEYAREVARLLVEWDTIVALISHWIGAEKELYENAEKVQKIADLVSSAKSKAAKAFKEGGEAALKELGEDVAKDVAKGLLKEVSDTLSTLLDLKDIAIREIGIGIAKGLTGIDPRENAIRLRKQAEVLCTQLQSWVSHKYAWSARRPAETLQSCIEDMQALLDEIDKQLEAFEKAVAGLRCIKCEVPKDVVENIAKLRENLNRYMKSFTDLIQEVERRLTQALKLFKRKDVYPRPGFHWMKRSRELSEEISETLKESREKRKK